jgi:hypothetical protein
VETQALHDDNRTLLKATRTRLRKPAGTSSYPPLSSNIPRATSNKPPPTRTLRPRWSSKTPISGNASAPRSTTTTSQKTATRISSIRTCPQLLLQPPCRPHRNHTCFRPLHLFQICAMFLVQLPRCSGAEVIAPTGFVGKKYGKLSSNQHVDLIGTVERCLRRRRGQCDSQVN